MQATLHCYARLTFKNSSPNAWECNTNWTISLANLYRGFIPCHPIRHNIKVALMSTKRYRIFSIAQQRESKYSKYPVQRTKVVPRTGWYSHLSLVTSSRCRFWSKLRLRRCLHLSASPGTSSRKLDGWNEIAWLKKANDKRWALEEFRLSFPHPVDTIKEILASSGISSATQESHVSDFRSGANLMLYDLCQLVYWSEIGPFNPVLCLTVNPWPAGDSTQMRTHCYEDGCVIAITLL